jgi:hypothetical protein
MIPVCAAYIYGVISVDSKSEIDLLIYALGSCLAGKRYTCDRLHATVLICCLLHHA